MPLSPRRCRAALVAALVLATACRPMTPPGGAPVRNALRCVPETLGAVGTLTLVMPVPHGRELSIQNPAGDFFMLVLTNPQATDGPMLMSADAFRTMGEVRLPVESLRAKPFVAGRDSAELVFSRLGEYRVHVGEVLNTDDGTPVATCTVYRYPGR